MLSAIYAASLSFHRIRDTWKRCVTLFVTPDEFLKRKLVEAGFDGGRIRVVSNPFDASHCAPAFDRGNYALFVGRLIRPKGIFTLLDATLRTEGIRVVIAGDGEEAENVRKHEAVVSGRAVFIGPVYGEEFKRLIADAGFVIVPSEWYDNLPMIVCQAFAYGKPVLASRINGIPEFVKHELNGLLFDPGDSAGLAEAMDRAYHDISLRSRLARAARSTAEEVLSPYSWQRKMHEVLQEAIQMGTSQESD